MVELRPGARFRSSVCTTEVIVVKGTGQVDLTCGGEPMVEIGTPKRSDAPSPNTTGGSLLGKRYGDTDDAIEVLCTKAGSGSMALGATVLSVKEPKPLPASD